MKEIFEFRIPERRAREFLQKSKEISFCGDVWKVTVERSAPLFERIGDLEKEHRKQGQIFFTSWDVRRKYSKSELLNAKLFKVRVTSVIEPAAILSGTKFNLEKVCPHCGDGRRQDGEFFYDCRKLSKKATVDFVQTIDGEILVSKAVLDCLREYGISEACFEPVKCAGKNRDQTTNWFHLSNVDSEIPLDSRTSGGNNPFDLDSGGEYKCPDGHVLGLNILSEVFVAPPFLSKGSFFRTKQKFGWTQEVLRPEAVTLVSSDVVSAFSNQGIRGIRLEVAHVV